MLPTYCLYTQISAQSKTEKKKKTAHMNIMKKYLCQFMLGESQ